MSIDTRRTPTTISLTDSLTVSIGGEQFTFPPPDEVATMGEPLAQQTVQRAMATATAARMVVAASTPGSVEVILRLATPLIPAAVLILLNAPDVWQAQFIGIITFFLVVPPMGIQYFKNRLINQQVRQLDAYIQTCEHARNPGCIRPLNVAQHAITVLRKRLVECIIVCVGISGAAPNNGERRTPHDRNTRTMNLPDRTTPTGDVIGAPTPAQLGDWDGTLRVKNPTGATKYLFFPAADTLSKTECRKQKVLAEQAHTMLHGRTSQMDSLLLTSMGALVTVMLAWGAKFVFVAMGTGLTFALFVAGVLLGLRAMAQGWRLLRGLPAPHPATEKEPPSNTALQEQLLLCRIAAYQTRLIELGDDPDA